jgi:hypothetical protein
MNFITRICMVAARCWTGTGTTRFRQKAGSSALGPYDAFRIGANTSRASPARRKASAPECTVCGGDGDRHLCNLYSLTKGQQAIRELAGAMSDRTGNLPPLPGIFPDYRAPIVRNQPEGRELTMARWGMPSPLLALKGRNSDSGVTNIRNVIPALAALASYRASLRGAILRWESETSPFVFVGELGSPFTPPALPG